MIYSVTLCNRYACQFGTISKHTNANARHTVGDDYARQTTAIIERSLANARKLAVFAENYARQTTATKERRIANAHHTIGDNKACIRFSYSILYKCSSVFVVQDAVYRLIIFVVFVNGYTRQTTANTERIIANTCHAIGDDYARQTTAIKERIRSNARHLVAVDICGDHDVQIGAGAQTRDGAGGSVCIHLIGKAD